MPNAISLEFARIHQVCHALSGALNHLVHFAALCVAPTSLHIALEQVVINGLENELRHLGSGCIVEEDEFWSSVQRREDGADGCYREVGRSSEWTLALEDTLALNGQFCSWPSGTTLKGFYESNLANLYRAASLVKSAGDLRNLERPLPVPISGSENEPVLNLLPNLT